MRADVAPHERLALLATPVRRGQGAGGAALPADLGVASPAKPLPGREVAVLVLNAGLDNVTLSLSLETDVPGRPQGATARDVWNHADVAVPPTRRLALSLHAHDSSLLVLQQTAQARWW